MQIWKKRTGGIHRIFPKVAQDEHNCRARIVGLSRRGTVPLPAETMLVGRRVLLQESSQLQERVLLQQVHLRHGLAVDLQRCRAEAGPVGALEAVPPQPVPAEKTGDRARTGHQKVSARHMQELQQTYC